MYRKVCIREMLVTILNWIYIGTVCLSIGMGLTHLLEKVLRCTFKRNGFHYMAVGITAITVYVEYFSLIGKIGMTAHLLMLLAAIVSGWFGRRELSAIVSKHLRKDFFWEGFFYAGIILLFSFFASRGEFHTDTGIYHGQAIRWYEEYGVVKGLGNLQLHYAYNSAYLAFASVFSLFWLFGTSLHTTTGFMEVFLCIYACHGLRGFWKRRVHRADFCRIAMLLYLLNIICRSMSPATDFGTMMMAFYLLLRWMEIGENRGNTQDYALLAVLAVFVMTMKLSAVSLLLLALYPAWHLVKENEWRRIIIYILLGFMILLPFLWRNIILSGWLIYPFAGLDLFSVDWKIPQAYLEVDAAQITVWGRKLFDIKKIGMPLQDWFPIWWEGQERYDKMLMAAVVFGTVLAGWQTIGRLVRSREKDSGAMLVYYLNLLAGLLVWFVLAPFIRYGLVFILVMPAMAVGEALSRETKGLEKIVTGILIAVIFFSVSPFWDHYITDAGVFVKQRLRDEYYIMPRDYDRPETKMVESGETEFYVPVKGEFLSYYAFPGGCYEFMIERTELRGESIEDGFRAK